MEENKSNQKSGEDKVKAPAKPKRITKSDWKKVETFLKNELDMRKRSDYRTKAEAKWKEIDRQIAMEAMTKLNRDGTSDQTGWHNVFELGELSKSAEDIKADVRRIVFPQSRAWFDVHSEIQAPFDPKTGEQQVDNKIQSRVDGRLRSLMLQQQADFGLYDAVEDSVGEALKHGSFCVEVVEKDQRMVFDGTSIKTRTAAAWVNHSMWNCFPDPSPSAISNGMFYEGSMYVESYLPRHKSERLVKSGADGFIPKHWKKVAKDEHKIVGPDGERTVKDVKLVTYWGDINIERGEEEGDLYFPNHKAILMNGTIVYLAPNKTPYTPIIYKGYERVDVRDPYYTSPIIKMSPMQKLSTMLANKAMDGIELKLEPPIVYDGNDPDFALNGGPVIEPGAKVSTKGNNAFSQIEIGDPKTAIDFLQFCMAEMRDKLGRPMQKKSVADRKTAAEVNKLDQDEEVSLVGFIERMEEALRSFLYMQHQINLAQDEGWEYTYYSPEMEDPDFLRIRVRDLPKNVHFEVVGARGLLGEQERTQRMSVVTAFAAGNPLFAPLLNPKEILLQMYQDAGVKNPEHLLGQIGQMNPGQAMAQLMQAKQDIQKLGGLLQQEKQKSAVKMAKIQSDEKSKREKLIADSQSKHEKIVSDYAAKMEKLRAEFGQQSAQHSHEMKTEFMNLLADRDKHHREMMVRIIEAAKEGDMGKAEKAVKGKDKPLNTEVMAKQIEGHSKAVTEAVVASAKDSAESNRKVAEALEMLAATMSAPTEVIREGGKIVGARKRLNS